MQAYLRTRTPHPPGLTKIPQRRQREFSGTECSTEQASSLKQQGQCIKMNASDLAGVECRVHAGLGVSAYVVMLALVGVH